MKKVNVNPQNTIVVEKMSRSFEGIAFFQGLKLYIDFVLQNEEIEGSLYDIHQTYARFKMSKVNKPSPYRIKSICPHYEKCGGCNMMHVNYEKQLEFKRQKVLDAFKQVDIEVDCITDNCLPSIDKLFYRNKMQLPIREDKGIKKIGLFEKRSQNLIKIDKCYLHNEIINEIYLTASEILLSSRLSFYDSEKKTGFLRSLYIRACESTKEAFVVIVTNGKEKLELKKIAKEIIKKCPNVKGVWQNIHINQNNTLLSDDYVLLEGTPYIHAVVDSMAFKLSPASFFQANTNQAKNIYLAAIDLLKISKEDVVLDAYCGIGIISHFFAKKAKKVIGIEISQRAIYDAKENAKINKLKNISFVAADIKEAISDVEDISIACINPPWKGVEEEVLKKLVLLKPRAIAYISCNPDSLARDSKILIEDGYKLKLLKPFDMFPQTFHVETLAIFLKK